MQRKIDTYASIAPQVSTIPPLQNAPPPPYQSRLLMVVIMKTTDDDISPSLQYRINLINNNTLSDENLMIGGIGRNI
jgi:hypothetical protein